MCLRYLSEVNALFQTNGVPFFLLAVRPSGCGCLLAVSGVVAALPGALQEPAVP